MCLIYLVGSRAPTSLFSISARFPAAVLHCSSDSWVSYRYDASTYLKEEEKAHVATLAPHHRGQGAVGHTPPPMALRSGDEEPEREEVRHPALAYSSTKSGPSPSSQWWQPSSSARRRRTFFKLAAVAFLKLVVVAALPLGM